MIYATGGDNPNSNLLALKINKSNGSENDKAPAKIQMNIVHRDLIDLGLAEKKTKDDHEMNIKAVDIDIEINGSITVSNSATNTPAINGNNADNKNAIPTTTYTALASLYSLSPY